MQASDYQPAPDSGSEGVTPDELKELMRKRSEYLIDLDSIKPQEHHWVDRGVVMSCEGAGHPNHRAYKRTR
jgi:hypothetical protein